MNSTEVDLHTYFFLHLRGHLDTFKDPFILTRDWMFSAPNSQHGHLSNSKPPEAASKGGHGGERPKQSPAEGRRAAVVQPLGEGKARKEVIRREGPTPREIHRDLKRQSSGGKLDGHSTLPPPPCDWCLPCSNEEYSFIVDRMTFVDVPAGWIDKAMGISGTYYWRSCNTQRRRTVFFSATTFIFTPLAVSHESTATEKSLQTRPQSTNMTTINPPSRTACCDRTLSDNKDGQGVTAPAEVVHASPQVG